MASPDERASGNGLPTGFCAAGLLTREAGGQRVETWALAPVVPAADCMADGAVLPGYGAAGRGGDVIAWASGFGRRHGVAARVVRLASHRGGAGANRRVGRAWRAGAAVGDP